MGAAAGVVGEWSVRGRKGKERTQLRKQGVRREVQFSNESERTVRRIVYKSRSWGEEEGVSSFIILSFIIIFS